MLGLIALMWSHLSLCAQTPGHSHTPKDSSQNTKNDSKLHVNWNVEGGQWFLGGAGGQPIHVPDIIATMRKEVYGNYNPRYSLDNPLAHSAVYFRLKSLTKLAEGVSIAADFIGEHRGFSYGTFSTENMIVFPQLRFDVKRSIKLAKDSLQKIDFDLKVGNFVNLRLNEGLMLYNMDGQGADVNFRYKKWRYQIFMLGDMAGSIGLGIDDSWNHTFSYEGLPLGKRLKADFRAGSFNHLSIYDSVSNHFGSQFSAAVYSDKVRFYTQSAFKGNLLGDPINDRKDYALLAGIKQEHKNRIWQIKNVLEFRFYGGRFNKNLKNVYLTNYRKTRNPGSFGGTIGNHLYPIYQYDRPFSQWAVFTEYQYDYWSQNKVLYDAKNVAAGTWQCSIDCKPYRELLLHANIDINHIKAQEVDGFTYAFMTLGVGFDFGNQLRMLLLISNKGMNLDVNYPTLYNYTNPLTGFSISRTLQSGS